MKQDLEIKISRRGETIWQCRAEALDLLPAEAEVNEDTAQPGARMRLKFHYTSKLDRVLRTPSDYNIDVVSRIVPDATILAIQQTACGRYVELSI